jgi:ribosomal protein L6P/L9E
MARRKKVTRSSKIGDDLRNLLLMASADLQKEIEKVADKAAQVAHISYDRELRATGLQRSEVSGSAAKQSKKSRGKASDAKSIFDTRGEVIRLKDGRLVAKGGSDIDSEYIAGFWDRDDPAVIFGEHTGDNLNDVAATDAKDFAKNAHKTAKAQIDAMFKAVFENTLRKLGR